MSARRGKRTVWIVLGLIGIQLGMIFTNCAKTDLKSLAVVESSSAGISNNENIYILSCIPKPAVPVISKITSSDLSESPSKMEHLRSRGGELADIKLSVVIDHECLKNQVSKVFQEIGQETRKNQARGAYTFKVKSQDDLKTLEAKLNADPCVLKMDENVVAHVFGDSQPDPLISQQAHLAAIQQPDVIGSIFNLNNGINSIVRVAVLDTGIDLNHVDLRDRLARTSSGKILAYNAIEGDEMVQDSGFHGTHVAGLIAATSDNGVGGSGVLGKNVVIMPVRVSADGQSIDSQSLYNGLVWAADNGAQVVNLSLGGPTEMPLVRDAILYAVKKGAVVLVASGNNGKKLALPGNVILSNGKSYPYCPSIGAGNYNDYSTCAIYPAVYGSQIDGMITVGSYDITSGQTSYFSNFSSDYVEILAPGSKGNGGILSTVPASLSSTGYASIFNGSPIQGTSMATPVASGAVAAAIALGQSRGYDMLPEQIEALLKIGSPIRAQFSGFSQAGRFLNLKSVINRLDNEMHLSISPASGMPASRAIAWGLLKIATQPVRATVLAGAQAKLAVSMSADSSILRNYQWYRDGIALLGQNRSELVFDQVKTTDAGLYHVVVRAGTNQVVSNRVPLNVGRAYCN